MKRLVFLLDLHPHYAGEMRDSGIAALALMPAMPPHRIDLCELKSQLAKRLGPERARRYFFYLHQLLSHKLSKREIDKLCFFTIGRENVSLHNQLIQSVIKNAFQAKVPPPSKRSLQRGDVLKPPPPLAWSNHEYLSQSPRRRRSVTQRSKFGINEKVDFSVLENGDLYCHDFKRWKESEDGKNAEQPEKICRLDSSGGWEVDFGQKGDVIKQKNHLKLSHGPLEAPLGVPLCPGSVSRAKRCLSPIRRSSSIGSLRSFLDNGELCSTEDLRIRMERIAERHGLGGVELDSANLLNYGLDAYLKELIKSSTELLCTRLSPKAIHQPVPRQEAYDTHINGIWDDSNPSDLQERKCFWITLQEFTVAMKFNPHQLGHDASLWLEKICLHSFE